jgi:hypothetical protein
MENVQYRRDKHCLNVSIAQPWAWYRDESKLSDMCKENLYVLSMTSISAASVVLGSIEASGY